MALGQHHAQHAIKAHTAAVPPMHYVHRAMLVHIRIPLGQHHANRVVPVHIKIPQDSILVKVAAHKQAANTRAVHLALIQYRIAI